MSDAPSRSGESVSGSPRPNDAGRTISARVGGGLIVGLGLVLSGVHVRHAFRMDGFASTLLQAVVPLALSLGVVGVGATVARGRALEDHDVPRFLAWVALGGTVLVMSALWMLQHHALTGDLPAHAVELLANAFTVGVVAGIVTGTYDVRRRETQRALRRQNDRLDDFASVVSHDLRGPMSIARGHLGLLREDVDGDHESIEHIADALERMDAIVEDILALARRGDEVVDPEAVDLESVARSTWSSVDAEGATLEVEDDLGMIRADRTLVQELLENLFRNAVEHGSTSPRSQAREDAVEHGSASSGAADRESALEDGGRTGEDFVVRIGRTADGFYVTDDGPGVPESVREDVFEHGFSTGPSTGLGLTIVERIADAHGWTVGIAGGDDSSRFEFSGVDEPSTPGESG